jgi:hypothetical protein
MEAATARERVSPRAALILVARPRWYEKAGLLAGELNSRLDALDEVQKETGL